MMRCAICPRSPRGPPPRLAWRGSSRPLGTWLPPALVSRSESYVLWVELVDDLLIFKRAVVLQVRVNLGEIL